MAVKDVLVQVLDGLDAGAVLDVDVSVLTKQQVGVVRHDVAVVDHSGLTANVLRERFTAIFRRPAAIKWV